MWKYFIFFVLWISGLPAWADPAGVDLLVRNFDAAVLAKKTEFQKVQANPQDKAWVKAKILHMVDIDQFLRFFPNNNRIWESSPEDREYFWSIYSPRSSALDAQNLVDLKALLRVYPWFRISEFGKDIDGKAWLLVQHADADILFQKHILGILETLFPLGETEPANYAYLFDRVRTGERALQRYGTQGKCVGPGKWEPFPMEDAARVDARRASMGLPPMDEYKSWFKDICH